MNNIYMGRSIIKCKYYQSIDVIMYYTDDYSLRKCVRLSLVDKYLTRAVAKDVIKGVRHRRKWRHRLGRIEIEERTSERQNSTQ